MMSMIPVKPAKAEEVVRNPDRAQRRLAVGGELVPDSMFWARRIRAGDVVRISDEDWKKIEADKKTAAEKAEADKTRDGKADLDKAPSSQPGLKPIAPVPPRPVASAAPPPAATPASSTLAKPVA